MLGTALLDSQLAKVPVLVLFSKQDVAGATQPAALEALIRAEVSSGKMMCGGYVRGYCRNPDQLPIQYALHFFTCFLF
jgi:hypothetical protein